MGKKSKPPAAPDYSALAKQTADSANAAAQATTVANRPNVTTAQGSSQWTQGPDGTWQNVQTLNPADQARLESTRQLQQGQINTAQGLLGQAQGSMANPLDTSGMTDWGRNPTTSGFGAVQEVQDAMMGRLRPDLDRARMAEKQRLVNQGIPEDSEAFQRAMERRDRADTDASQQALLGAVNTQNQLFNQGLAGNQFADRQRLQQFSEAVDTRELPIQEMLRMQQAGGQVSPNLALPNFMSATGQQGVDYMGAGSNQYQAAMDAYNAKQAQSGGMLKGLMGIGGSLLGGPLGGALGSAIGGAMGGTGASTGAGSFAGGLVNRMGW